MPIVPAGDSIPDIPCDSAREHWQDMVAFPAFLNALHARPQETELRRAVLRSLAQNDDFCPARNANDRTEKDLARNLGAQHACVRRSDSQANAGILIGNLHRLMQQDDAAVGLAALHAYESRVPEIAASTTADLGDNHEAETANTFCVAVHHGQEATGTDGWKQSIHAELTPDPGGMDRALTAAEAAAQALWSALDGVERLRMQRTAN